MLTYETVTQELIYHSDIFFFNMEYICMADFERTLSSTNNHWLVNCAKNFFSTPT